MEKLRMAVIDNNTLALMGLKMILQNVMPIMKVETFGSFTELEAAGKDDFIHYFAATNIVLSNMPFFLQHSHMTIVLTTSSDPNSQLSGFRSLCINVPEELLVRNILMLEQTGHPHGKNLPDMPKVLKEKILSDREIEVLSFVAQGKMNKEIADQLNIGLTTVITHRKNIQEKLGLKTVSALTIYAVMHGYVDVNKI